jgi:hypothetical protein
MGETKAAWTRLELHKIRAKLRWDDEAGRVKKSEKIMLKEGP